MAPITLAIETIIGIIALLFAAIAIVVALVQIIVPGTSGPQTRYIVAGIFFVITMFTLAVGVYFLVVAESLPQAKEVANLNESTPTLVTTPNQLTVIATKPSATATLILPTKTPIPPTPTGGILSIV